MNYFHTVVATLLLAFTASAFAHVEMESTTPKSGSTLTQSPPAIELHFDDPAKLTSVTVTGSDKIERRLTFKATDKENIFNVTEPKLAVGRNVVKWKALSRDGHVAGGSLVFVIKPAAKTK